MNCHGRKWVEIPPSWKKILIIQKSSNCDFSSRLLNLYESMKFYQTQQFNLIQNWPKIEMKLHKWYRLEWHTAVDKDCILIPQDKWLVLSKYAHMIFSLLPQWNPEAVDGVEKTRLLSCTPLSPCGGLAPVNRDIAIISTYNEPTSI